MQSRLFKQKEEPEAQRCVPGVKRQPVGSSMASMGRKGRLKEAGGGQLGYNGGKSGLKS